MRTRDLAARYLNVDDKSFQLSSARAGEMWMIVSQMSGTNESDFAIRVAFIGGFIALTYYEGCKFDGVFVQFVERNCELQCL